MKPVSGVLLLRGPMPGGVVHVRVCLRDAPMADGPSEEVAVQEFCLQGPIPRHIPFLLRPDASPAPRSRWLFDATVSSRPGGQLSKGDFVLTRAIEFRPEMVSGINLPLDLIL
ncbi:hypothetical protein [Roseateles sp. DC23W]